MGQPTWREIKRVTVPEREESIWTPALDYITPGKLYRILVPAKSVGSTAAASALPTESRDDKASGQAGGGSPQASAADDPLAPVDTEDEPGVPSAQDQRWQPESGKECTADGDRRISRNDAIFIEGCASGALIAKVGGSTADLKADKDKLVLFSVGRHCVFSISDPAKAGSLYLGINDTAVARVRGRLEVTIFEAL
jgi:hypothetical protein